MKVENRRSINEQLKKFHPQAKEDSYIEVTEWINGEGWDITIDERTFSMHFDELDAINYLIKVIEYEGKDLRDYE